MIYTDVFFSVLIRYINFGIEVNEAFISCDLEKITRVPNDGLCWMRSNYAFKNWNSFHWFRLNGLILQINLIPRYNFERFTYIHMNENIASCHKSFKSLQIQIPCQGNPQNNLMTCLCIFITANFFEVLQHQNIAKIP